jgi:hypothetical protein
MENQGELTWRRSSKSSGGACVEIAIGDAVVHVRDSKDPGGPALTFHRETFREFIGQVGRMIPAQSGPTARR